METPPVLELVDGKGAVHGVCIRGDIWDAIKGEVTPLIKAIVQPQEPARPEPLHDWETLLQYWDFAYPPDRIVVCDQCGARSEDWMADDPRKFTLKAATMAGLVNFECQQCKARVVKRHFKDRYKFECRPFIPEKR